MLNLQPLIGDRQEISRAATTYAALPIDYLRVLGPDHIHIRITCT